MKDSEVPEEHKATIHEDAKVEPATELSKTRVADTLDAGGGGFIPLKCINNVNALIGGEASVHVRQDTDENDMESKQVMSTSPSIVEINSRVHDPQACTSYDHHICSNIRTSELKGRPSFDYMERLQHDKLGCGGNMRRSAHCSEAGVFESLARSVIFSDDEIFPPEIHPGGTSIF
ncbi:hypothetical protein MLD38_006145 [Melastoma candidum]|uniref:Uncharacterized protein n=1 Tax=Melastoma candidum TaxID=119954 RepID=A0ACB9RLC2_9MYRT|nr:hypothetical protein MLD38_006145 [Melastoma candidum]